MKKTKALFTVFLSTRLLFGCLKIRKMNLNRRIRIVSKKLLRRRAYWMA